jgi:predicted CXXCH cytochrome family protein
MFAYTDTMTIRGLWQKPEFAQLVKRVQLTNDISEVVVNLKGWSDSTFTTPYDDPNEGERSLYKLHVRLIPGANEIYCAPAGHKENAMLYASTLTIESKSTSDRTHLFHNSALEQSCMSCHEGLPSSFNGDSMSADCNVCHKLMSSGSLYQHAPAEMKECESCHSWSKEKHAVVVEKGVPTVCYDCHSEKQAEVESSTSIHPVASECVTCHSTHGTDQQHIVKEDVYSLCTSCHEDQKLNHPVGRHPLRFAQLRTGGEISCVSCHNPHGSENESLLKAPGGRMGICEQCH